MNKPIIAQIAALWIIASLVLAACASAAAPDRTYQESAPAAPAELYAGEPATADEAGNSGGVVAQPEKRIVIKNATLELVVNDPPEAMDRIGKMAEEMDGFIVSANLSERQLENGNKVPQASITIRVPVDSLNEALERIRAESQRLPLSETLDSQDVTKEYTDLQSRLRNLESAETQLTRIMEEANRTEDVLNVYNELVRVREQIEVIKGQIQFYEQSAALSAIRVELLANEAIQPLTIGGWEPVGVAKDAVQTLISGMKFLANAAIWIGLFVIPFFLVLYLVFFLPLRLLWRTVRRRTAASRPVPPAATPPGPAAQA